jgi:outer membrane lipoprotein-sorting protein
MTKLIPFLLIIFIFPSLSFANESLETVLARMKPKQAIAIAYQEKRSMGLFSEDRINQGYFYSTPKNILLKSQQTPAIEIMGIVENQLYYYNKNNNQRYQTQMSDDLPMSLHINAFKGLINGNLAALKKQYFLEFFSTDNQWTITLTAKDYDEEQEQPFKVIMQGLAKQAANYLLIIDPDDDRSEFSLNPQEINDSTEKTINQLLKLLKGQP